MKRHKPQYILTHYVFRYRKVPSDRCEGGFSPQFAAQTVRPCGVKPTPGPPANSSPQVTHFDAPVSRFVFLNIVCILIYSCSVLTAVVCFFSGRKVSLDPGVCRSRSNRPDSYRFRCSCCQESGL